MSSTTNETPDPVGPNDIPEVPDAGPGTGPDGVPDGVETIGAATPGEDDGSIKDPQDWVTGDEPMTDAQRSYLDTLAKRAGEQLPADLTKAQASEHIDRLQAMTGLNNPS